MKKVLFISNVPVPYRMEFFRELAKQISLTVVFEAKSGKFQYNYDLNSTGFDIVYLQENSKKNTSWPKLSEELNKDYDYIIVGGIATKMAILAIIYMQIKQIPYFIEVDGAICKKDSYLKKCLKTFLVRPASGYFSSSKESDAYLEKYGALENKIFRYAFTSVKRDNIISEFLSEKSIKKVKADLNLDIGLPVVLCVGRFIYRKGIDVLLNAWKRVNGKYQLIIIGGIPGKEYEDLVRNLKLERVLFLDFMTKEELDKFYKIADVFVLPTREEVWGLVINEAMAFGKPIITTDNCVAGKELVKDGYNGFIVPVNDENKLAEYIEKILSNDQIREKMRWNSIEVIKRYTIEQMVEDHLEVIGK